MRLSRILPIVLGICLLGLPASSVHAIDKEKQAAIIKLIGLSGGLDSIKSAVPQVAGGISDAIKQQNPQMPRRALEIVAEEAKRISLTDENLGYMILATAEIYDRHFTLKEIKALNAFYGSKVGQKTVKVMPKILQESFVASQKWGEMLMPKIIEASHTRWIKEGLMKKEGLLRK